VVEVVEYVKDVTAEKRLQQQVIQSERLAVVGRMSANVAHEIKNPWERLSSTPSFCRKS